MYLLKKLIKKQYGDVQNTFLKGIQSRSSDSKMSVVRDNFCL